ncbi:hypothetical protein GCM10010149_35120 [Nonomuraea roseoviolacea subsp. roseoviolacea]
MFVRPLFSIVGLADALGKPATPIVLTAMISLAWVHIVGLARVRRSVLTPALAGAVYAVFAIATSGLLLRGITVALFGSTSILAARPDAATAARGALILPMGGDVPRLQTCGN